VQTSIPASSAVRLCLAALVLALLVIAYAHLAQGEFQFGADPSIYIGTAKSLAAGEGYRIAGRAQTQYPPAWPVLLVPVSWLTPGDYADYARFTAALFPLACLVSYALYRVRKERFAPWLIIAFIGSTSVFNIATRDIRSEVLFITLTVGFLVWCLASDLTRSRMAAIADIAIGTVLMVTAVAARSIGVSIVVAVVLLAVHLAVRAREIPWVFIRRITTPLLGSVVYLVWWARWTRVNHTELYAGEFMNSYDRQFWLRDPHFPDAGPATILDVLHRIPGNLTYQAAHNAELLTNIGWLSPVWTSPVVVISALIVFAGLIDEFRSSVPILAYYVVAYVGILSVWPFDEGTRFLVPLFPILLLLALHGWRVLTRVAELRSRLVWLLIGLLSVVELIALTFKSGYSAMGLARQDVAAVVIWLLSLALALLINCGLVRGRSYILRSWRLIGPAYLAGYLLLGGAGIVASARWNLRRERGTRAEALHALSRWILENAADSTVIMAQSCKSRGLA
jgi:hypothetical protein